MTTQATTNYFIMIYFAKRFKREKAMAVAAIIGAIDVPGFFPGRKRIVVAGNARTHHFVVINAIHRPPCCYRMAVLTISAAREVILRLRRSCATLHMTLRAIAGDAGMIKKDFNL